MAGLFLDQMKQMNKNVFCTMAIFGSHGIFMCASYEPGANLFIRTRAVLARDRGRVDKFTCGDSRDTERSEVRPAGQERMSGPERSEVRPAGQERM